jgi:hypothetical protein
MKPLKEFIIDRKIWLRADTKESMLLRERDSKMCCVGIFCKTILGMPDNILKNNGTVMELPEKFSDMWTLSNDDWLDNVYLSNDRVEPDEKKEASLTEYFKEIGYELKFIN